MTDEDEWTQYEVIHCPLKDCKGMLMQNKSRFVHENKCSDCGRYFIASVEWKETEAPPNIGLEKK